MLVLCKLFVFVFFLIVEIFFFVFRYIALYVAETDFRNMKTTPFAEQLRKELSSFDEKYVSKAKAKVNEMIEFLHSPRPPQMKIKTLI